MKIEDLDDETFKAIKKLVKGFCLKEEVNEYVLDGNGNKQLAKQKVTRKIVPPNTDIIKMIFTKTETQNTNFDNWTDAELEKEKQRLLKLLKKGENNEYRANQSENKV